MGAVQVCCECEMPADIGGFEAVHRGAVGPLCVDCAGLFDDDGNRSRVCEDCDGIGKVSVVNKITVDERTKWARSFEETLLAECQACDGHGRIMEDV
jgi:DnaJ-class molecular chaperone